MRRSELTTISDLIAEAQHVLKEGPHPERARLDAEVLLLHVVQGNDPSRDRAWLIRESQTSLLAQSQVRYSQLVARRAAGEPMQYILGETEFFGLPFSVGSGVLIPRPETEHLVEEVLHLAQKLSANPLRIADIGTGSGIIAVALAHALAQAKIDAQIEAVDLSSQALRIARNNANRNHVNDRIRFHEGDLLTPLTGQRLQIIASNPPYIPTADHDSLAVEVRNHEPHTALFAGEDGLTIYRRLIPESIAHLEPGGWLVQEIGFGQQQAIADLLQKHGYSSIHFRADYQQIPRVAIAQRP